MVMHVSLFFFILSFTDAGSRYFNLLIIAVFDPFFAIAITFVSLSVNSVKQSDTKCHSELSEESQLDCFGSLLHN